LSFLVRKRRHNHKRKECGYEVFSCSPIKEKKEIKE